MLVLLLGCAPYSGPLLESPDPLEMTVSIGRLENEEESGQTEVVESEAFQFTNVSPDTVILYPRSPWTEEMDFTAMTTGEVYASDFELVYLEPGESFETYAVLTLSWVWEEPEPGVYTDRSAPYGAWACLDEACAKPSDPESLRVYFTVTLEE